MNFCQPSQAALAASGWPAPVPCVDEQLQAELAEVAHRHPGFRTWLSAERRAWAERDGATFRADSPSGLDVKLSTWEQMQHQHPGAAA